MAGSRGNRKLRGGSGPTILKHFELEMCWSWVTLSAVSGRVVVPVFLAVVSQRAPCVVPTDGDTYGRLAL